MSRLRLLPHVFVAGHRPPRPATTYASGRKLRAAIAANAALMTFAGDDAATRAPGGHDPFTTVASAPNAAPAAPDHAAPANPGRERAA